jgi:myosin-1
MLEDYLSEGAFESNLAERFNAQLNYTYIRNVLISINPFEDLNVVGRVACRPTFLPPVYHLHGLGLIAGVPPLQFSPTLIKEYYGKSLFELPPHLYAVANQAYYTMREETSDHCILVSGESGAGKTVGTGSRKAAATAKCLLVLLAPRSSLFVGAQEASKQILQFLVANATDTGKAQATRDRLLQSNPILEAFGNAKTSRNDNSSRFGKYMEVQFDFKGEPVGGRILTYLLEKSRIVTQLEGERNFHIFYMILLSGDENMCQALGLQPGKLDYALITKVSC